MLPRLLLSPSPLSRIALRKSRKTQLELTKLIIPGNQRRVISPSPLPPRLPPLVAIVAVDVVLLVAVAVVDALSARRRRLRRSWIKRWRTTSRPLRVATTPWSPTATLLRPPAETPWTRIRCSELRPTDQMLWTTSPCFHSTTLLPSAFSLSYFAMRFRQVRLLIRAIRFRPVRLLVRAIRFFSPTNCTLVP